MSEEKEPLDPQTKKTIQWMKKASTVKPPAGLSTRILARIEAQERKKSRRPWVWGFSGGLATAVVAMLVVMSTSQRPADKAVVMDRYDAPVAKMPAAPAKKLQKDVPAESDRLIRQGVPERTQMAESQEKNVFVEKKEFGSARAKNFYDARGAADMMAGAPALKTKDDSKQRRLTTYVVRQKNSLFPDVDFKKNMVLVVFDGTIVSQQVENGTLVVRYRRDKPVSDRPTSSLTVPVFTGPVEFRIVN